MIFWINSWFFDEFVKIRDFSMSRILRFQNGIKEDVIFRINSRFFELIPNFVIFRINSLFFEWIRDFSKEFVIFRVNSWFFEINRFFFRIISWFSLTHPPRYIHRHSHLCLPESLHWITFINDLRGAHSLDAMN